MALFLHVAMFDYCYELPKGLQIVVDHPDAFVPGLYYTTRQSKIHRWIFALIDAWKFQQFQKKATSQSDINIVVTGNDRQILRTLCPSARIAVLPTGVDIERIAPDQFDEYDEFGFEIDLLLTGIFTYAPNIDAAEFLCRDIMPLVWQKRPSTNVTLIGWQFDDKVKALASERTRILERVPDIRPYLKAAKIFVAPYRFAFGIRYKLLEAMAMGKAIVGTSTGFLGIPVQDGVHALIRDDPEGFAEAILMLLNNADLRWTLGKTAREFIAEHYDQREIVAQLNDLLEGLLS